MFTTKLNPALGMVVAGSMVDDHTFVATISTGQLFHLSPDPRDTEDPKLRASSPAISALYEVRRDVQRLFEGEKERNVASYSEYLLKLHIEKINGEVPAIILWSDIPLDFDVLPNAAPLAYLQVPFGKQLVAIDGETQLAARHLANRKNPAMVQAPVTVKICHGRSVEWARQAFHDLNVLGVQPNAAIALAMDLRDPLTAIAREVELHVPFFRGRINNDSRQLKKRDEAVFTITALRSGVVTLAEGIAGVKYGTGPVEVHSSRLPTIRDVALEWFSEVTKAIGTDMEDRGNKVAGTPPVLAALGAMGHELLNFDSPGERRLRMEELITKLKQVRWEKGATWDGIIGKFTPKGAFSVGGTKETVYAVHRAITEPMSPEGLKVRGMRLESIASSN